MNSTRVRRIVFTEEQIKSRVKQLSELITNDYKDKHPILISVLKGTMYFIADLTRNLNFPLNIDFMSIGVYHGVTSNSGIVRINKDLDLNITGRHVLFVEDIINTGLTMGYLVQNLESRKPASIEICTLLDNPRKRLMNIPLEYVGFEVPDVYLVGYGLDHEQEYRHLPYIGELGR